MRKSRRFLFVLGVLTVFILTVQMTLTSEPTQTSSPVRPHSLLAPSYSAVMASGNPSYSQGSLLSGLYTDTWTSDSVFQVSQASAYYINQQNAAAYCGAAQDNSLVGAVPWSNPSRAQGAEDNQYATTVSDYDNHSHYLLCPYSGFPQIPAASAIVGITVEVYRHASMNVFDQIVHMCVTDDHVRLFNGSTPVGSDKASTSRWPTSDAWATYGSSSDGWDAGIHPVDVNNDNLGVAISVEITSHEVIDPQTPAGPVTASIDAVKVTVYYAEPRYHLNMSYSFQFTSANPAWIQSLNLSTEGMTGASSVSLYMWNYQTAQWDPIGITYTGTKTLQTSSLNKTKYMDPAYNIKLQFNKTSEASPFTLSVDLIKFDISYIKQYRVQFTPHIPAGESFTVNINYTTGQQVFAVTGVANASTVDVWVDACSFFNMDDIWVSSYSWFEPDYARPANITSDTVLNITYVKKVNKAVGLDILSNSYSPGGVLDINIMLTTTYGNMLAEHANLTIIVLSENKTLVDRSFVIWSSRTLVMSNNVALISIPLPDDIGNGTLWVQVTVFGRVEPTSRQVILQQYTPPPVDFTAILVIGASLSAVLVASLAAVIVRRGRTQRLVSEEQRQLASRAKTPLEVLSSAGSVAHMKFDMARGVELEVIHDRSKSKFLQFLREDPTRCTNYFDSAKNSKGTLAVFEKGEHVLFVPCGYGMSQRGSRYLKDVLVISSSNEFKKKEIEAIRNRLLEISDDEKVLEKSLSKLRGST